LVQKFNDSKRSSIFPKRKSLKLIKDQEIEITKLSKVMFLYLKLRTHYIHRKHNFMANLYFYITVY